MKVCINGQGHMTKMAAMAINSKNLEKSSSPEGQNLMDRIFMKKNCPEGIVCPCPTLP